MTNERAGYWIAHMDIHDSERYAEYAQLNSVEIAKAGGAFLARRGRSETQGNLRAKTVIIKFPTYDAAINYLNSDVYKDLKRRRDGIADVDIVIVEGHVE